MDEARTRVGDYEGLVCSILDKNEMVTLKTVSSKFRLPQIESKKFLTDFIQYLIKTSLGDKINVCICSAALSSNSEIPSLKISFDSIKLSEILQSKIPNIVSVQKSYIDTPYLYVNNNVKEDREPAFHKMFFGLSGNETGCFQQPLQPNPPLLEMQNYVSTSKHPAPDVPCSPIEPIVVDNAKSSSEPPIKKNLKRKTAKSKQKIDEIVAPGSAPLTQCNDEDPIPKSLKLETFSGTIRKRVLKERCHTNENGFLVTEKYYEFVDEEDTRPILSESANIVTSTQKSTEKSLSQSSLTSFFKKSQ